jgi:integrase
MDRPIFDFMRYTGCRPNEARGLLRESVHHDQGYITISTVLDSKGELVERTKTKRVRILPIIPEITAAITPREATRFVFTRGGVPYRKRVLERIWNNACGKAGVKINLYNGLKHSFGMQRLNQGFSLDSIAAVMGHTSTKTTSRYAQYLADKLSPVMSGLVHKLHTRKKARQ